MVDFLVGEVLHKNDKFLFNMFPVSFTRYSRTSITTNTWYYHQHMILLPTHDIATNT